MVGRGGLTFGEDSLLRRVHDTSLGAFRGRELDRVRVHLSGSNDLSRIRIPRVRLRTLHGRTQLSVEVLNGIFDITLSNPLNAPADRPISIRPPELNILGIGIFMVDWPVAVTAASTNAVLVAPDERTNSLTVQGDRTLIRTDSATLKARTRPPGAGHVGLVSVGRRHFLDRTGQRRLVSSTLTNDSAVIECEGERGVPDERGLALVRNGRDGERLADSQLLHGPGATDADLG